MLHTLFCFLSHFGTAFIPPHPLLNFPHVLPALPILFLLQHCRVFIVKVTSFRRFLYRHEIEIKFQTRSIRGHTDRQQMLPYKRVSKQDAAQKLPLVTRLRGNDVVVNRSSHHPLVTHVVFPYIFFSNSYFVTFVFVGLCSYVLLIYVDS